MSPLPLPRTHHRPSRAAARPRPAGVLLLAAAAAVAVGAGCFPEALLGVPPAAEAAPADVVALAGADLVVLEGARVVLAGRGSRALNGEASLSWSQIDGPPVLLTNSSSPLPAFVAPLAPASLTFELRADADGASAVDDVTVTVVSAPAGEPVFLTVPGDAVAEPGSEHSFEVGVKSAVSNPDTTLRALAACGRGSSARVDGRTVTVEIGDRLPCIVVVDGVVDGAGAAPAARIFWPLGTPLPRNTSVDPASTLSIDDPTIRARVVVRGGDGDDASVVHLWPASGSDDLLPGGVDGADVSFAVPSRKARLAVAAERRLAGASGGVQYAIINVSASGDLPPVADGGNDRVVSPGARFRIDTSQTFDQNGGDVVTVDIAQVLGPNAQPDPSAPGVFIAPTLDGPDDVTLLFHVVAFDGVLHSPPDPVRVVVSSRAENLPPVLTLPPERFVIPDEVFTVDGRGAEDPDSGVIASVNIAEDPEDDPLILPAAVDVDHVELTALAAGDVYHFTITAFDEQGLGTSVAQTVTVEEAGPYVDGARGDDTSGNGTAAAPFRTVGGAVQTAVRHELPELFVAEGVQAAFTGALPERVSLRGGFHFDGSAYAAGGGETTLPVHGADGLSLSTGHLADLTVSIDGTGSLTLLRTSALDHVRLVESADHAAPLLVVAPAAAATIASSTIEPHAAHADDVAADPGAKNPASVVLLTSSVSAFIDSEVRGAPGDAATGILCQHAVAALDGTTVRGGDGAVVATGIRALPGSSLDAEASDIAGGAAESTAIGIDAADSLLTLDAVTVVTGATSDAANGTAVSYSGDARSALIRARLQSGAAAVNVASANGLVSVGAQVTLDGAVIDARGAAAVALRVTGGVLSTSAAQLSSAVDGVVLDDVDDVGLSDTTVTAAERAVAGTSTSSVTLSGATLVAGRIGVDADGADVSAVLSRITVDASAAADETGVGVRAASGSLQDTIVDVAGPTAATGVVFTSAGAASSLVRTAVTAASPAAAVAVSATSATISSTFLDAGAGDALVGSGILTLRQATILGPVRLSAAANLDAANSVLGGGLFAAADPPWTQAVALALPATGPLVTTPTFTAATLGDLAAHGVDCVVCLTVEVSDFVDDTGHLVAGDNPLVDAADATLTQPDDIDGDARPQGPRPDIGCDERAP